MNLKELEAYFEEDESLVHLMELHRSSFERIEYYENRFRSGTMSLDERDQALLELSAIFSSLTNIVEYSDAHRINAENEYFDKRRQEIEYAGQKINVDQLKKEASSKTSFLRRVHAFFYGRLSGCDKMISCLQSSLKSIVREKTLN